MRQSYVREVKGLKQTQRFRGKSHSNKSGEGGSQDAYYRGRLVGELLSELPSDSKYRGHLELFRSFVNGELLDGHKIYSLQHYKFWENSASVP